MLLVAAEPMADQLFQPSRILVLRIRMVRSFSLLLHSEAVRGLKLSDPTPFPNRRGIHCCDAAVVSDDDGRYRPIRPCYIQFVCITLVGLASCLIWLREAGSFKVPPARGERSAIARHRRSNVHHHDHAIADVLGGHTDPGVMYPRRKSVYNALVRISVFTNITILAINSASRFPGLRRLGLPATDKPSRQTTRSRQDDLPEFAADLLILAIFPATLLSFSGKTLPDTSSALSAIGGSVHGRSGRIAFRNS